jgi:hypothetical protein
MWKTYGAHALAYVIGGLTLAQAYAGAVPGKGTVIAVSAGILLAAINHIQAIAANSTTTLPPPSVTKVVIPFALLLLGGVLAGSGLSGCSVFSKLTTPAAQPYITAAVDVAVATAESKGVPAAQINSICKTALAADAGTAATLATVASVVNVELAKLNLPAGDLAAARILEDALSIAIQAQVGANPNVATAQAAIANVLNTAIAATGG